MVVVAVLWDVELQLTKIGESVGLGLRIGLSVGGLGLSAWIFALLDGLNLRFRHVLRLLFPRRWHSQAFLDLLFDSYFFPHQVVGGH